MENASTYLLKDMLLSSDLMLSSGVVEKGGREP